MAWLAVDKKGKERIFRNKPEFNHFEWLDDEEEEENYGYDEEEDDDYQALWQQFGFESRNATTLLGIS